MPDTKPPLIVLTGPTACGKTEVGVRMALGLQTEIISADSVQVYKKFNIGSAKPSAELLGRVRHHLLDVVSPGEEYNVARFKDEAGAIAKGLWSEKKVPLIVGGTGLYLKGLIEGLHCAVKTSDAAQKKLDKIYIDEGQAGAYGMAQKIDPGWMAKVHPNDTFRTMRLLGVYLTTGETLTQMFSHDRAEPEWDVLFLVLDLPREELYKRIERRVDTMIAQGLKEEVTSLKKMGYNNETKAMRALGYKEIYNETEGKLTPDETPGLIKKSTKAFARRQLTWFRKAPGAIFVPIGPDDDASDIADAIFNLDETRKFLHRRDIRCGLGC